MTSQYSAEDAPMSSELGVSVVCSVQVPVQVLSAFCYDHTDRLPQYSYADNNGSPSQTVAGTTRDVATRVGVVLDIWYCFGAYLCLCTKPCRFLPLPKN